MANKLGFKDKLANEVRLEISIRTGKEHFCIWLHRLLIKFSNYTNYSWNTIVHKSVGNSRWMVTSFYFIFIEINPFGETPDKRGRFSVGSKKKKLTLLHSDQFRCKIELRWQCQISSIERLRHGRHQWKWPTWSRRYQSRFELHWFTRKYRLSR